MLTLRRLERSGRLCHLVGRGHGALTAMIGFAYFRELLTLIKLSSLGSWFSTQWA
jgi:hypothetical protein